MTRPQIRALIAIYDEALANYPAERMDTNQYIGDLQESYTASQKGMGHIRWMLNELFELVKPDRIEDQDLMRQIREGEKIQRWIGFIQGALWAAGIFSIDELRDQVTSIQTTHV